MPNHSTLVAYLALFAALATGGAYAADRIGSSDIAKNAVKSRHIGPKQVKSVDIAPGAAKPRAIALVDKDGSGGFFNVRIRERGFDEVESGIEGIYCLTPSRSARIDVRRDAPLLTLDYGVSSEHNAIVTWDSASNDCEADEYEVDTLEYDGVLTDDAAFLIVVP